MNEVRQNPRKNILHKICQNSVFFWPDFPIFSLIQENTGQRKPVFWHILHSDKKTENDQNVPIKIVNHEILTKILTGPSL